MEIFIETFVKMFFIMTPFFVVSIFLTVTDGAQDKEKKSLAVKVTIAVIIISLIFLFFGQNIFATFGLTIDAFRIGSGGLMFLTAVNLVRGNKDGQKIDGSNISELAVVPLAVPVVIGPGTIGILLILGANFETTTNLLIGSFALVCAVVVIGIMLYFSNVIKKIVGRQGLIVISKFTGLFLAALSAQIVFTGIKNFLNLG